MEKAALLCLNGPQWSLLCALLTFVCLLSDVRARDEAKEVPLHWELLVCSQPGGEGRVDVHEEQQL